MEYERGVRVGEFCRDEGGEAIGEFRFFFFCRERTFSFSSSEVVCLGVYSGAAGKMGIMLSVSGVGDEGRGEI